MLEDKINKTNILYPRKISISYKFHEAISRVFNVLKNFALSHKYFVDLYEKPEFIVGNNTYDKENQFSILWENKIKLNFKVSIVIDEDCYKKIAWLITPESMSDRTYEYSYTLLYTTIDNITILKWETNYENCNFPFSKNILKKYHKKLLDSCIRYELFIKNNYEFLSFLESIVIKGARSEIFDIATNLDKLQNVLPQNFSNIKFLDNNKTEFTMIEGLTNIKFLVKILERNNDENNSKWKFTYESKGIEALNFNLNHSLKMRFIEVSPNVNFVYAKIIFQEAVDYEIYKVLRKGLINALILGKNMFENSNLPSRNIY